jgi:hypothetical protein
VPAFAAQSTSGEGMIPKKTVAAAARAVGTRIIRHLVWPGFVAGGGASRPASGEPPAIAGRASAPAAGRIHTAAMTRR